MTSELVGWVVVALIVGYLFGAINPASIIARARGIDLAASGSGNPGATNAGRVMGRRTGVIVAVLDVLKGFIPALAFTLLVGPDVGAVAGFAAVLGHMTSPFLHGHGGKGVATTLGVVLALDPLWLIPVVVTFVIVRFIVKRTGIASVFGCLALIVIALIDHGTWAVSIMVILIAVMVIFRHHRNLGAAWVDFRSRRGPQAPVG